LAEIKVTIVVDDEEKFLEQFEKFIRTCHDERIGLPRDRNLNIYQHRVLLIIMNVDECVKFISRFIEDKCQFNLVGMIKGAIRRIEVEEKGIEERGKNKENPVPMKNP
jgi:hypothetical protein